MCQLIDFIPENVILAPSMRLLVNLVGDYKFERLPWAALLTLHALIHEIISKYEDNAPEYLYSVLRMLKNHIIERVVVLEATEGVSAAAQVLYDQEKPYLRLKQVAYAQLLVLRDFIGRIRKAGDKHLQKEVQSRARRLVELFTFLTKTTIAQDLDLHSEDWSLDDLMLIITPGINDSISPKEQSKILSELKRMHISEALSEMDLSDRIDWFLELLDEYRRLEAETA